MMALFLLKFDLGPSPTEKWGYKIALCNFVVLNIRECDGKIEGK